MLRRFFSGGTSDGSRAGWISGGKPRRSHSCASRGRVGGSTPGSSLFGAQFLFGFLGGTLIERAYRPFVSEVSYDRSSSETRRISLHLEAIPRRGRRRASHMSRNTAPTAPLFSTGIVSGDDSGLVSALDTYTPPPS
jgi:hypothetical protein